MKQTTKTMNRGTEEQMVIRGSIDEQADLVRRHPLGMRCLKSQAALMTPHACHSPEDFRLPKK